MKIKFGTNRIVIICKNNVYKLAITIRGIIANYVEFKNSIDNDFVARTEYHWYGLKQEKLTNITIYKYREVIDNILPEHKFLHKYNIHNRLQVGKNKDGLWKIFDYEDTKYYFKKEYLE